MRAHTPGPWLIYPETDGTEICAVTCAPGLPVRQLITRPERGANWIENARLIAAAPDLLDALKQMVSIVAIHQSATGNNFAWAEMEIARAAITKATEDVA